MLQYYAIEFFAPTIITGYLDVSRQFAIYAMSEIVSLVGVSLDVSAVVEVYSWNSFERVGFSEYNVTLVSISYSNPCFGQLCKIL